jgi:hypothetical protein
MSTSTNYTFDLKFKRPSESLYSYIIKGTFIGTGGTSITSLDVDENNTTVPTPIVNLINAPGSKHLITRIPDNKPANVTNSSYISSYEVIGSTITSLSITNQPSGISTNSQIIIAFKNNFTPITNDSDGILFFLNNAIQPYFVRIYGTNGSRVEIYNPDGNIIEPSFDAIFTYVIVPDNQVCMPAGTVVQTDQGACCIESLDKQTHMFDGRRLVAVSKTIARTEYSYMVLFRTHALGPNVPDKDTFVTTGHKVGVSEGEGGMVEAGTVLGWGTNPLVSAAQSQKGEILYNVLLDTYEVVTANNMRVETLHPSNPVARLYQEEERRLTPDALVEVPNAEF